MLYNVPTGTRPTPSSSELQQILKGIEDLKASQEQNFSSIRDQLDNHEERIRAIEKASAAGPGKKQMQQRNCYRCGKLGHIARNCRVGSVQGSYEQARFLLSFLRSLHIRTTLHVN